MKRDVLSNRLHVRCAIAVSLVLLSGCSCSRPPGPVEPHPGGDAGVEDHDVAPPADDAGTAVEADVAPPPADDAGTPEPEATVPESVQGDDEHPVRIFFAAEKTEIPEIAFSLLDAVAERLRLRPGESVRLVSHADSTEEPGHATEISRGRGEAIVNYLVQRGIAKERFLIDARGDYEPAGDSATEEGRAANRRVDFVFETGYTTPTTPSSTTL
jgi:outer membrane protein OmpA-like peptidoglycan-associated protein